LSTTPTLAATEWPDFSHAGYGGTVIPDVAVKVVVVPTAGDATARIQSAIDHVATLAVNESGTRGAVLLPLADTPSRGN